MGEIGFKLKKLLKREPSHKLEVMLKKCFLIEIPYLILLSLIILKLSHIKISAKNNPNCKFNITQSHLTHKNSPKVHRTLPVFSTLQKNNKVNKNPP
jgi:ssDNA-binding Zn-finger/Zn-ribbon topoisomerase 1